MYETALKKLEPQKIYTYTEILKTISPQSSTASYILQDLIASGYVENVLHPVLDVRGYRLHQ